METSSVGATYSVVEETYLWKPAPQERHISSRGDPSTKTSSVGATYQ